MVVHDGARARVASPPSVFVKVEPVTAASVSPVYRGAQAGIKEASGDAGRDPGTAETGPAHRGAGEPDEGRARSARSQGASLDRLVAGSQRGPEVVQLPS